MEIKAEGEPANGGRPLSFTILILLLLWTVDAMLLQTEMAVFHSTPLPNAAIKAVLIVLAIAVGVMRWVSGRAQAVPARLFGLWLGFLLFLTADAAVFMLRFKYPADYIFFGYNAYYFAIVLLPLFFYLRETVAESRIVKLAVLWFVPLTVLGVTQHFAGDPLLPTDSPNGYLEILSWNFMGTVRGFSLFSSPAMFGHFLALVGSLGLALYLSRTGSAKKSLAIVFLALLGGYATFTRTTELEIAAAMLTVWTIYRAPRPTLQSALPLIYGVAGTMVALCTLAYGAVYRDDFFSSATLLERYMGWVRYGALWVANGLATFLLGAGLVQNDRFRQGQGIVVDNSYLGVAVHTGAIGLLSWLLITWTIWKYMLSELKRSVSPVRAAAAGAYSVWLLTSVFGVNVFYPLPFLLFLATDGQYRRRRVGVHSVPLPRKPRRPAVAGLEGGAVAGPA